MSARLLLDRLEQQGLLEPTVVADLRRQLDQAARPVSAEALAKLLVQNGHLTKFQAARLVEEVTAAREEKREARVESAEERRQKAAESERKAAADKELASLLGDLADTAPASSSPKSAEGSRSPASERAAAAGRSSSRPGRAPQSPPADARTSSQPPKREDSAILGSRSSGTRPMLRDPWQTTDDQATEGSPAVEPQLTGPELVEPELVQEARGSGSPATAQPAAGIPHGNEAWLDGSGGSVETTDFAQSDPLAAAMPAAPLPAAVKKKRLRTNPWESPLILVGGFTLIVLVVLSLVMWYSLTRGTAAEYFEAAEQDYRSGAYANAMAKFDKFLRFYANDPHASLARVRRHMAQLRIEAEGARDPMQGLRAAQQILPQIENEEAFHEARAELANLLPDLARAFAERAKNASSAQEAQQLLEKVDEAMTLVNNPAYIPTTHRKTQAGVIERIEETVTQVRRDIQREQQLAKALSEMDSAISAGETRAALRIRDALVAEYPGLARHPQVVERISAVAQRERDLIAVRQNDRTPVSSEVPDPIHRILLYSRAGEAAPANSTPVLVVPIQGTVYGVEWQSGRILWRRFVGWDNTFSPKPLSSAPTADWLLMDSDQWRLMRVRPEDGRIVWQLPVQEPFHHPVVWRDRVLIATRSGRVLNVSSEDGQGSRVTDFGQPVDVGVGADGKYPTYYQVGEYDNLYAVSVETMECREVFYLGHRRGEINVPPTVAAGMLFVALNSGPNFAFVHVLSMDRDGTNLKLAQDPIRLDGHVIVPPLVVGRRIVFTTSIGSVVALEVNPQDNPPVRREIAPMPPTRTEPQITFATAESGTIWLADRRLLAYDIQASQAQFARRWVNFDGHTFVSPLVQGSGTIVSVRQPPQSPGYRVAAVDGATGKTLYWQTDLGFPLLAVVPTPDNDLIAFSSNGATYRISATDDVSSVEAAADLRLGDVPFHAVVPLRDGRYVLFSRRGRALLFDPAQRSTSLQLVQLNIPSDSSQTEPLELGNQLVVPLLNGEIVAVDLVAGAPKLLPFQPPLKPGAVVRWTVPVRLPGEAEEFVIADDQQHLYRVGIVESGGRRLSSLQHVTTEEPLMGRLAVLGQKVLAVAARSDTDVLWSFALPRLEPESAQQLPGRVVWGPYTYKELALLAVTDDQVRVLLLALDQQRTVRWQLALQHGRPTGATLSEDGQLLVATDGGALMRVEYDSGRLVAVTELGEPAGGTPLVVGGTVWLPAADGALLRLSVPQP